MKFNFVANFSEIRLDKFLQKKTDISRSELKKYIDEGFAKVNGKVQKPSYKLEIGDEIEFEYQKEEVEIKKENLPLDIIYEDEEILVINKPQDMLVHPTNEVFEKTLVNALLYRYEKLGNMEDKIRPGIVHRLDKDTSGILAVAKTDEAYRNLVDSFSKGKVERKYLAIVHGNLRKDLVLDMPIGRKPKNRTKMAVVENGKIAKSKVHVIKNFDSYALLEVEIFTGRTHQIRVHLSNINHPVVGDLIYGYKNKLKIEKQLLHCYHISFEHPTTKKQLTFETKMPKRFEDFIKGTEK